MINEPKATAVELHWGSKVMFKRLDWLTQLRCVSVNVYVVNLWLT